MLSRRQARPRSRRGVELGIGYVLIKCYIYSPLIYALRLQDTSRPCDGSMATRTTGDSTLEIARMHR